MSLPLSFYVARSLVRTHARSLSVPVLLLQVDRLSQSPLLMNYFYCVRGEPIPLPVLQQMQLLAMLLP